MRVLDLFSGIGGFSLGLERTGMRTVAFCEVDPFCRAVLAQHWPGVPIYDDVRTLTATALRRDGIAVDLICGGFPCQDISHAGKRAGLEGARSGLWSEYRRLVGELRPRVVVVENVAALLGLGMGTVLGDLSALGYDAVWDCIPASAVGAPHRRDRVWIVAYAARDEQGRQVERTERERTGAGCQPISSPMAHTSGQRDEPLREPRDLAGTGGQAQGEGHQRERRRRTADGRREDVADANGPRRAQPQWAGEALSGTGSSEPSGPIGGGWGAWLIEPDVGRVADGVPARVDRLRALGNAVVPQIPALIGRAIMSAMANP